MNTAEYNTFCEYLKSLKIYKFDICDDEFSSIKTINIQPSLDSNINKLSKNINQIGLFFNAIEKPIVRYDFENGLYQIEIRCGEMKAKAFNLFSRSNGEIPLKIGIDKYGKEVSVDLLEMPNLMIGGTPGSGKSTLIHSIILSLLEADCTIYLCDPKVVELSRYSHIKKINSVSKDVEELSKQLDLIESILDSRFKLLRKNGCLDIKEYRKKVSNDMMYNVLVIDEWSTFSMNKSNIPDRIANIAQKGRAAGICIIIATQRPSSKIFPGIIKASFSGKIAMRTSSAAESRIIIDRGGAEKLSAKGAGILVSPQYNSEIIFRSPWIDDVSAIIKERYPKNWYSIFGF